jgi:hypothetical protein
MLDISNIRLLYRATTDGFSTNKFHLKCDGEAKTVTIIENNQNHVFGGYTAAEWKNDEDYGWISDSNAFIFSLRRNGISNDQKFKIIDQKHSILGHAAYGPSFGHDILIENDSNIKTGSFCNLGNHYELPVGYEYGVDNTLSYLAGNFDSWLTKEIEVFQIL